MGRQGTSFASWVKKNRLAAGRGSEMTPGGETGSPGDTARSNLPTGAALEQEGKAVKVH